MTIERPPSLEFVLERARREELAQALAEREGDVSVTERLVNGRWSWLRLAGLLLAVGCASPP
ncbi:hypothetical protein, partial [Corallococcus exiguus]|uniref:hypothetical protein n=1 Tax=Corallococcus exiguus TaxID=83462 RepID=UPI001C12E71D